MKQRVLVVEDNSLNRELLCDWLESEGFEVWHAAGLDASYEAFAKTVPGIVLLDIQLGAEDGLTLVGWMLRKPEFREIPVIAVTAHALPAEQEQILRAGCKACLAKPVNFQQLRDELNRWFQDPRTSQVIS